MTALDDSPSPPLPTRNPFSLGFRTPADPLSSSLPSPTTSPESSSDPDEDPAQGSAEWDAASSPASPDDDSSARTSDSRSDAEAVEVELFSEEDLTVLARGGVAFAGDKAHDMLATTPGKVAVELYRADEADQAQIGDPLARIVHRHQGVGGKVNPDVKDLMSSLVGLFSYGVKQINRTTQARALDAGAQPAQPAQPAAVDL